MTMTHANEMTAAAEVWQVAPDAASAQLIQGVYGPCEALRLASQGLTLDVGQGLVGAVLARQVPVLLSDLDDESFERTQPAQSGGVTAVLALPMFDENRLAYVTVFMYRSAPEMIGAVELWAARRGRFELGLAEEFAPGLDHFAKLSRYVGFPKGSGLPGVVWERSTPWLIRGIGHSKMFLRSTGAETAGLTTGLGYPVRRGNELLAVATWLSSGVSPLIRRHEVWLSSDGNPETLALAQVADAGDTPARHEALRDPVRMAAKERRPMVLETEGLPLAEGENAVTGVAILPVLNHDKVSAVGVLAW